MNVKSFNRCMLAGTSNDNIYPSGPGCSNVKDGYPPDK